jgi:hypothetical protein
MTRFIAHILILLVLFTHSTMAMDVHIPHKADHTVEHFSADFSVDFVNTVSVDTEQTLCVDAGGHCSHHQAHTVGLVSVNTLLNKKTQPILLSLVKLSALLHTQTPPLRPPKA